MDLADEKHRRLETCKQLPKATVEATAGVMVGAVVRGIMGRVRLRS